ncbi:hypothetical protein C9374_006971 [Naegleria lovaniensis]|uniref:Uncharacterized protein n=1 Tax=Naegleria lovaniensis TaxID=51637 RepID=A0AA88GYR9_NAELO|nr:uncharacterized protein C9374_006971 [Naegleria lovaniensis]KAG2393440.1 hypothetical protein C9374_006971 [Naegleria lovaniensis]
MDVTSLIPRLLFLSEIYLLVSHAFVFTRLYKPKEQALKNMGMWFFYDGVSGLSILFVLSEQTLNSIYFYFVMFHFIAHMFYVLTWHNGYYSIRIRKWSSAEYSREAPYVTVDFFLTLYDMSIHAINAFLLYQSGKFSHFI